MAEMSVGKGRDAVARIEGTSQQSGGLARPQVSPSPRGEGKRQQQGEEAEGLLVEIGEEARHSSQEEQAETTPTRQAETDSEEKQEQGAIVDVVV